MKWCVPLESMKLIFRVSVISQGDSGWYQQFDTGTRSHENIRDKNNTVVRKIRYRMNIAEDFVSNLGNQNEDSRKGECGRKYKRKAKWYTEQKQSKLDFQQTWEKRDTNAMCKGEKITRGRQPQRNIVNITKIGSLVEIETFLEKAFL